MLYIMIYVHLCACAGMLLQDNANDTVDLQFPQGGLLLSETSSPGQDEHTTTTKQYYKVQVLVHL